MRSSMYNDRRIAYNRIKNDDQMILILTPGIDFLVLTFSLITWLDVEQTWQ